MNERHTDIKENTSLGRDETAKHPLPSIVFMLYYSRSGSTFLSANLDRYEDIGVTVESNFMRTLVLKKERFLRAMSIREAYNLILGEGRVSNLGLSFDNFASHLRDGGGYTVEELTRAILSAYFADKKPHCTVWVVKDGANGFWINQISKEIPNARYVHVVRDGRAVLNSGLNTARPYVEGERMARDPLTQARLWTRFVDGIDEFVEANPDLCAECRYEDLIINEAAEIKFLRRFLGLEEEGKKEGGGYFERLPEREKSIHKRANMGASAVRIEAWKDELPEGDLLAFQFKSSEILRRHGYEMAGESELIRLLLNRRFLGAYVRSVLLRIRGWWRLLFDPNKLKHTINTKLLYRRDRRV